MSSRGRLRTPSLKARFLTEDDLEVMYDDSDDDLDKGGNSMSDKKNIEEVSTDYEDERMAADDNKKENGMEAETGTLNDTGSDVCILLSVVLTYTSLSSPLNWYRYLLYPPIHKPQM